jgi:hypothetical protein
MKGICTVTLLETELHDIIMALALLAHNHANMGEDGDEKARRKAQSLRLLVARLKQELKANV